MNGGRFEFDDGGSYCGGWEEAKAHGHGVCTGPQGKGEYAGAWHYGFEVSGEYRWTSGNVYSGQWQNGQRHGLGQEQRGRWMYKGDWTAGKKGRYGVRSSMTSQARYAGTWSDNFHDGYGTEVYVDGGLYQGQWLRGIRHGYGIRKSAVHSTAARLRRAQNHASLTSLRSGQLEMTEDEGENKNNVEGRGGFVLKANSCAPARRRRSLSERSLAMKRSLLSGLRIRKQHSTGDIHQKVSNYTTTGSLRSSGSMLSCASDDSNGKGVQVDPEEEQIDDNVTETYWGEWKNDGRNGYGICERTDGLKYQGEWVNNMKNGHGVTTMKDGTREEGKYKNNVLIMSMKKKGVLFVRSSRLRERVEGAVEAAARASDISKQKADIAASRTSTAKERAEQAAQCAKQARDDADMARIHAKQFDPNFKQPGTEGIRRAANSVDSPRTQLSSDLSSRSSKPPSFDHTGDMATDPLAYQPMTNHVVQNNPRVPQMAYSTTGPNEINQQGQQPRLPHQTSSSSSHHLLQVNAPSNTHQVSFDETAYASTSNSQYGNHQNYAQQQPQGQYYQNELPQQKTSAYSMASSTSSAPYQMQNHVDMQSQQQLQQQSYQQQQYMQQAQQQMYNQPAGLPPMGPSTSSSTPATASARSQYDQQQQSNRDSMSSSLHQQPSTSNPTTKDSMATSSPSKGPLRNDLQSSRVSLVQADDHYEQYGMRSRRAATRDDSKSRAPRELSNGVGLNRRSTLAGAHDRSPLGALPQLRTLDATQEGEDPMGSLPNLHRLEESGVRLNREEAARLASDRRQAMFREEEDRELLRANPLRWFMHPTFRNILRRWKVPILLVVANLGLIILFYSLVTYDKKRGGGGGAAAAAAAGKKH